MKFEEFNISEKIMHAVTDMGFEEASPIQSKAIPLVLEGSDIIGQAQTGTGKTTAFGIPVLECIDVKEKVVQAVILCPTRELAIQVSEEIRKLGKYMHGVKILPVYGGQEIVKQIKSLKAGVQIVIGTPGRVMDHMRRKTIKFDNVKMVVLDEADEMLDMGFREDIETILQGVPAERQTLLFSATMPKAILDIARKYQKDATTIKMAKKELTVTNIEQYYFEVKPKNKDEILTRLIDIYSPKLSIVFCNTKKKVDELVDLLKGRGYFAEGLHGDMKQAQRDRVMNSFRKGKTEILIATDVAARGIDVDNLDAVFNYDLPQDDEYYVHRIGRTGRAGKTGAAYSFVVGKEIYKLKDIERYCKTKIKARAIPSADDIRNTRTEQVFKKVAALIETDDLSDMLALIDKQVNTSDFTAMDIAAAFLKMELGDRESQQTVTVSNDYDLDNTGGEEGMTRLFINIGKNQKITPGNILGAIAGESNIPGDVVGSIDIYDKYTFVDVPREMAADVLKAMKNAKIKGRTVNIEPAKSN